MPTNFCTRFFLMMSPKNSRKPARSGRDGSNTWGSICDVVEFTSFCDRHRPGEILKHLQTLIEALEESAIEYGLEKIKTVGDSFMATAGLLTPVANPALKCVRCALAMVARAKEVPPHWQVRVGVHVGPVIAGIVGRKKFQYDVWGDTVNSAARMQRVAEPSSVCVNGNTWKLLSEDCWELRKE